MAPKNATRVLFADGGPDVSYWPIATKFSLGLDVSFWGEAEVDWAAEFTASVANDPSLPLGVPIFCNAQGQGTVATLTPEFKATRMKGESCHGATLAHAPLLVLSAGSGSARS